MPTNNKNGGAACVELNFADLQIIDASISHGPNGELFRCKLGGLPDAVLASLETAAQSHNRVRLVFPGSKITFARVELSRYDSDQVELVGHLER
jgi:hypothetical protein